VTTTLVLLAIYVVAGYVVYVPSAVKTRTERLIIAWDKKADADAREERSGLAYAYARTSLFSSRRDATHYARRLKWEKEQINAIQPAPAPVEKLRQQAARLWPVWCLTWLPLLLAGWSVLAYRAATDHAASRAPRTSREIEADNARLAARLAELEAADEAWREANPS